MLHSYFCCSGRLAHAVTTKMREVENQSRQHEMSCCALYCHWFLSLFALAEASIRLMLHLSIVLIFFLGYYVVYCLSCGKANVGMMKGHQLTRCSLYSGLMFAMIGNLSKSQKSTVLFRFLSLKFSSTSSLLPAPSG